MVYNFTLCRRLRTFFANWLGSNPAISTQNIFPVIKMPQITSKKIGFYLNPYIWIKDSPLISKEALLFDGKKAKELVFQNNISSANYDICINVYRDGLFMFDFKKIKISSSILQAPIDFSEIDNALEVVRILNTYLVCLWLAILSKNKQIVDQGYSFKPFSISPQDLLCLEDYDDGKAQLEGKSDRFLWLIPKRGDLGKVTSFGNPENIDPYFRRFQIPISKEIILSSFDTIQVILSRNDSYKLIVLFELLSKSYHLNSLHDWDWSLMTSWAAIESTLSDFWKQFILKNEKIVNPDGLEMTFIDKTRKNRLEDFRSYSSSVQLEVLSLADELDFSLFGSLQKLRKCRNDWIHSLKHVSSEDAENAAKTLLEFMDLVYSLNLARSNPS